MTLSPEPRRKAPVFHERRTYRQRRVMDAGRILPVLGLFLWLIPLLWPSDAVGGVSASHALIFVFGVWGLLIIISAIIALGLRDAAGDQSDGRQ